MRLEFVKAFVDITQSIFVETLSTEVIAGRLSLESSPRAEGTVVTLIELSGDVLGRVIMHMEMPTAIAIAERMTGRSEISCSLITSCIAELAGMAIGRTVSWINDRSYNIQMSPPVVAINSQLQPLPNEVETLVFPLKTEYGDTIINASFIDLNYSAAD